ncbi:hypothetical protein OOK39_21880 [Streptomyces sp. NBC_00264]|uniref:hypothetical protein n=1 Tax=unclassified Streptomyces TaxID=2593676 RepID=UPI00225B12E2|nr:MULTISPECIES: hypothetical protein [unclassified Streptomyces]MCX5161895.1 hypothetical protein [Streptomyces sp. NBC_00305]MCX5220412.1 hypothetical protein [Streptomyces sp. NBC_00264]
MSRNQQRAPKGRDLDRLDRRAVVENLLARVHRTRLTSPEAALLGNYVREEQRAADATRSSLAGTTQALERNRQAADAAIIEAEQRAADAEKHASTAELEASQAEAALAYVRNAQTLGQALAAVARYDGLTAEAATMHAAFTDAADSTRARLDEQAREHAIELAGARRVIHAAERSLAAVRSARTWGETWAALGMYYGLPPEECARQARARRTDAEQAADRYLAAWRSARGRARRTETELERIRGWCAHWADRTRAAEPRLARLALAWRSARRRAQERTRDAYANGAEYRALRAAIEKRAAEQIAYAGPDLPY